MQQNRDVAARISRRRQETGVSPVRLHHMPRWMIKLCLKLRRDYGIGKDVKSWDCSQVTGELLFQEALRFFCPPSHSLWDHWGSTVLADGFTAFVLEPYAAIGDDWQFGISKLADALGCAVEIAADSWWYPDNTIRISFCPLDWQSVKCVARRSSGRRGTWRN